MASWLERLSLQDRVSGSSPGRIHGVGFLGRTFSSHSASLDPGVKMGTGDLSARGNPVMGYHHIPSRGQ